MNALSNYYEHGPLVLLQRPIVLIGSLGVDQHGLGRDLAALSGLPLIEVDRWIEHEAGQSLVSLVQTQGIEALRQLEDRFPRPSADHSSARHRRLGRWGADQRGQPAAGAGQSDAGTPQIIAG